MVGGGRRRGDMNDLSLRGGTKLTLKISDVFSNREYSGFDQTANRL